MVSFIGVLFVTILAYGVFMHALLFPDAKFTWEVIFRIVFRPYLLLFGEMGIENHHSKYSLFVTNKRKEIVFMF